MANQANLSMTLMLLTRKEGNGGGDKGYFIALFCRTALHLAAVKEDPALIDLLTATAVPSCRMQDSDGNTPLHKVTTFSFPLPLFSFCIPCGKHNIYTHHYLYSRI